MFYEWGFGMPSHWFLCLLLQSYTRLWHSVDAGAMALGSVDIMVRFRHKIDPYFSIPLLDPLVRWWKAWFLLKNDTDAPLSAFTGGRPIPHPN
jgi:hypothetical protein